MAAEVVRIEIRNHTIKQRTKPMMKGRAIRIPAVFVVALLVGLAAHAQAKEYTSGDNAESAERLIQMAKANDSDAREKLKDRFLPVLPEGQMQEASPPDYRVYPLGGSPIITLKRGEMTNHWIRMPGGMRTKYTIMVSSDKYEVVYRDGLVVRPYAGDKPPKWTDEDVKVRALEDGFQYQMIFRRAE